MTILTLHGEYFVEGKGAVVESLFKPLLNGKTASGFYERRKGKVLFYKANGELFAAFAHNSKFTGLVTAGIDQKSKTAVFYMQGLCTVDALMFGLNVGEYRSVKAYENSLLPFVK